MLLAALLLVPALAGAAEVVPPPPTRHLDDRAGLVPEAAARALDEKLAAFEARSGTQLVVSIFPSLPSASLEDFTVRTAQAWRIGQKKLDNGLLLFVFVAEHKLRIEVGYGLEGNVPDVVAKRVIEDVIAPRFRAGDPAGGLDAGADALIAAIEGGPAAAAGESATSLAQPDAEPTKSPLEAFIDVLMLRRVLGVPLIVPALFGTLAFLALPLRILPIRRRMRRGQRFFPAWMAEALVVLSWFASSKSSTYSSGGSSGSSGGFSGGGGSFGGGGASGGW